MSNRWTVCTVLAGALVASATAQADDPTIPVFVDRTDEVGLTHTHSTLAAILKAPHVMTPGAVVADFNQDGWLDVVAQGGLGQNLKLFMNDGTGHFTDQAVAWGIDIPVAEGGGIAAADVDGNGYPDLYVGSLYTGNYLFMNNGTVFFENAADAGVQMVPPQNFEQYGNTFGATFADIDLDGDLDMYTAMWGNDTQFGNRLFRNDGTGLFTDITVIAGLVQPSNEFYAFAPSLIDMNDDQYPELLVAADFFTSAYFRNNHDQTFTKLLDTNCCTDENGMGSAIGDYDNDGRLDWFVTSIFDDDGKAEAFWGITGNRLFRAVDEHEFEDVTDATGVRNGHWGWGAAFADFNHDGWLDLTMTNGYQLPDFSNPDPTFIDDPSRLWINRGVFDNDETFIEVAKAAGVNHTESGKGLVTFDSDNDGDLDLIILTNRGELVYYENETPMSDQSWLQFDLVSPPGTAPHGIGTVVRVTHAGMTQRRTVHTGNTYMGHESLRLHFGIPDTPTVELVEITWANGAVNVMTDVATGQIVRGQQGNINGDQSVDAIDLSMLLDHWGTCPADAPCPTDLDGNGSTGPEDLAILLDNWST